MPKVSLHRDDHAYTLTLEAPPLNILDIEMLGEMREHLESIRSDRHALLITGAGERAFSAGASVQDHMGERIETMLTLFHDCFRILARLDLVTIALVRGAALGGGCELALACDFVLAADDARFGQPEIALGVFPPVAAWQLSRQTFPRRGLELLLTGDPIDAPAAERLGLVNAVFPAASFEHDARGWTERLFRRSASSVRLAKKAFRIADADDFAERLSAVERLYLEELMRTSDAEEGLRAFLEKRPPRWSGR